MPTQILSAELDFDTLKDSIKTYLSQFDEFTDYDFDASGLNIFIEALAYNTHQLAKVANFGLNESFLDTAQLRSSIASHAKTLGYVPRSKTAPVATLDIEALAVPSGSGSITIPKYTAFTTSVNGQSYTYYTIDDYTTTEDDDYVFSNVLVYEGSVKTKKFFIDSEETAYPVYVIPDQNIDISTLKVIIRNGVGSTSTRTLIRATLIGQLNSESDIYLINESANGYYELTIGDGVIGARGEEGEILEATYITTNGKDSNGARSFSTSATVGGYSLSITLVNNSSGGADKESIESIRFNAPLAFAAQNRLVTKEDYKSFIQNNFSFVESINVWGGEENVPVSYGTVYISVKPIGADTLTDLQKTQIETGISGKSVLNIDPVFDDPTYQYLDIDCDIFYDQSRTSLTKAQLQAEVRETIHEFGDDNLLNFGTTFYKSKLMTAIDNSNSSIISSDVDVNIRKRFFPVLGALDVYELTVTVPIKNPSSSTTPVLQSCGFTYTIDGVNYTAFLRNKEESTTLEVYRLNGTNEVIILSNAGSIDLSTNTITIGPFQPTGFLNNAKGIELIITPQDDISISPIRNQLLVIDEDATTVNAVSI